MPITVEVPEIGLIDFPDDFTEDQISKALAAEPWKQTGGTQAGAASMPSPPSASAPAVPPFRDAPTPPPFAPTPATPEQEYDPIRQLHEPLVSLPRLTGRDVELGLGPKGMAAVVPGLSGLAMRAPRTTAQVIAGLQQAIVGASEFFTSPVGIATLGASALPKLAQKGVAGYFVYQMAKQSPEMVKELAEAWYSNDPERLTNAAASLGLNTAFIVGGAKAITSKAPPARPPIIEQPTTEVPSAERLRTYERPVQEGRVEQQVGETQSRQDLERGASVQPGGEIQPRTEAQVEPISPAVATLGVAAEPGTAITSKPAKSAVSAVAETRLAAAGETVLPVEVAAEAARDPYIRQWYLNLPPERQAAYVERLQRKQPTEAEIEANAQEDRDVTLARMENSPELSLQAERIARNEPQRNALDQALLNKRVETDALWDAHAKVKRNTPESDALFDRAEKSSREYREMERLRDMVRVHEEKPVSAGAETRPAAAGEIKPTREEAIPSEKAKEEERVLAEPERTTAIPDIALWTEISANTREFNAKRTTKARKDEIITRQIELRKELLSKGYTPEQVKGVEMLQTDIPEAPARPAPAPETAQPKQAELMTPEQWQASRKPDTLTQAETRAAEAQAKFTEAHQKWQAMPEGITPKQKLDKRVASQAAEKLRTEARQEERIASEKRAAWEAGSVAEERRHRSKISDAFDAGRPVSAIALDTYGMKPREGYVREGDQYIKARPTPAPAEAVPAKGDAKTRIGEYLQSASSVTIAKGKVGDVPITIGLRKMGGGQSDLSVTVSAKGQSPVVLWRLNPQAWPFIEDIIEHSKTRLKEGATLDQVPLKTKSVTLPKESKPLGTGSPESDARLAELRKLKRRGMGMTAAQEQALEIYEAQSKADPSKWQIGEGVGWRVDKQINRGYRIEQIDPERKLALVRPVADTGLTVTGGGMEGIGPEWVHVADLVRDKKYDAPKPAPEPQRVTPEEGPKPTGPGTGVGPPAETKLANIVNQTIEQSTSPTKLGITPAGSTRPTDVVLGSQDLRSVSPTAEARWQASVREKPSLLARLQDTAVNAWHSITREYVGLPPREFPEQIDILRRLRASRNASARRTVDVLRGITHNLGPKQYGVFNRVVVLEDLLKDVESGKYADGRELPSGHANTAELTADLNKFKGIAEATPEIRAALERRQEFMDSLRATLVERGFLPETVLEDPRYFHHQVLMYMAAQRAGAPKSFRDWFSGWQKARVGSSKAYNRQYVEAEAEVIADAFNKMTMQDLQGQMKAASDLTAELKRLHGDEWTSHIPATHTKWQPKRGNVFYPVKTVAERVMEEYLAGLRDILPEEFKDAVAIGPKRAEWIIPKELAKVLDNLAPRKDTWIERLAGAGIGAWKRYILLNPLRALKYQLNNASGDVDFVFAANPKIFKEFKQAAIDSYNFHKRGKAATGDIKEAIDLGVAQSGWRASEIPDIGASEYFNWLTGSKPGILGRWWKWIGKWNDAREDTARLATYRFALKEWNSNKPFYGASVPADVQSLPTNKLKAAKVARELLIDYGRETEFGEFMRQKAVPFYRWMHGNFARYVQLVRNIPVQEGAGGARLAALGARKAAAKGGALAVRGAFAYMAINLWNHLFFPREEEELGEARNQLHLILGRDEQGNIQTVRFQGALSDLLGWVGLENLPQDAEDLFKGKASLGDKMEEGFEAGVSRAVNATSPFYKTAAEAMTGRSLYPNAFEPRPIRDKAEHVAGLFSLKNVYQWLAGKPHKPLRQELSGLLTYTIDPGEAAYNTTRHMAAEWLEDHGEERSQTIPGKRANALYYYKQALRYKDAKLAAKFKAEYEAMGGKQEGLQASVQRSAPLASLGKRQSEFITSLSPAEKAVVDRAQKWYHQVYR